jgi:hypothetical protein
MMTREEILSIEEYCAEHKVSHRKAPGRTEYTLLAFL